MALAEKAVDSSCWEILPNRGIECSENERAGETGMLDAYFYKHLSSRWRYMPEFSMCVFSTKHTGEALHGCCHIVLRKWPPGNVGCWLCFFLSGEELCVMSHLFVWKNDTSSDYGSTRLVFSEDCLHRNVKRRDLVLVTGIRESRCAGINGPLIGLLVFDLHWNTYFPSIRPHRSSQLKHPPE